MRSVIKETSFAIFFLIVIALVAVEAAEAASPEANEIPITFASP